MTDFPWLLAMIVVPAAGAAVVAALPKGRDDLAKQVYRIQATRGTTTRSTRTTTSPARSSGRTTWSR